MFRGMVKHFQRSLVRLRLEEDHGMVPNNSELLPCSSHRCGHYRSNAKSSIWFNLTLAHTNVVLNGVLIAVTSISYIENGRYIGGS